MLSLEQIEKRKGKLTASRVAVLMTGDSEGVLRLYKEMIGELPEEDLSAEWPVQLGSATERLNLDWYERKAGPVLRRGEVAVHPKNPWAACTLDGWDGKLGCPIECKHVGGREPIEVVIDRYQPQMQWQMEVTGARQCALSVISGASEPRIEYIDCDAVYAGEMLRRGKKFMICVAAQLPPLKLPPVPAPIPIDKMREVDFSENEVWRQEAGIWLQTYQAAKSAKDAEQVLKNMIEADVRKAFGCGIRITRDKAGRLSLREEKGK